MSTAFWSVLMHLWDISVNVYPTLLYLLCRKIYVLIYIQIYGMFHFKNILRTFYLQKWITNPILGLKLDCQTWCSAIIIYLNLVIGNMPYFDPQYTMYKKFQISFKLMCTMQLIFNSTRYLNKAHSKRFDNSFIIASVKTQEVKINSKH